MKKLILVWVVATYTLFFNLPFTHKAQASVSSGCAPSAISNYVSIPALYESTWSLTTTFFTNTLIDHTPTPLSAEGPAVPVLGEDCNEAKPSEIRASLSDPCPGIVVVYSVDANPDFTSYNWEMPRTTTGDMNSDWIILSGQGTNSIRVRTGKQNGTIKLAVTHAKCGNKVQTKPVQPKNGCTGTCVMPAMELSGPQVVCYVYDGSEEGVPYTVFVTKPAAGAIYDFILPEGFVKVGGDPGDPFIEVLTAFELATQDENPNMPGVQQVISVVSSFPDQACVTEISNLYVTLSEENCEPGEVLPVELVSFEGVSRSGLVELTWSTATEIDNDRFEVQRSNNGKDFTVIGQMKGAGNSNVLLSYRYTDRQAPSGIVYYRLNQIDFDLRQEYSKVVVVKHVTSNDQGLQMSLYPNPVTDGNLTIKMGHLPSQTRDMSLSLRDMNGKLIHSVLIDADTPEVTLPLKTLGLRQGLYMVSLISGSETRVQRIAVQ